jgi:hypothetical protein
MEKDFFGWAKVKANLHHKRKINYFNEREVWWCAMGANIGHEQDGKGKLWTRPVLILRKIKDPRPNGRGISEQRELAVLVELPVA